MDKDAINERMARFLGYQKYEEIQQVFEEDQEWMKPHYYIPKTPDGKVSNQEIYEVTDFKFNHSPEWLIPVVLKIEESGYYLSKSRTKEMHYAEFRVGGEGPQAYVHAKGYCEATDPLAFHISIYLAVDDFLQKHNKRILK